MAEAQRLDFDYEQIRKVIQSLLNEEKNKGPGTRIEVSLYFNFYSIHSITVLIYRLIRKFIDNLSVVELNKLRFIVSNTY